MTFLVFSVFPAPDSPLEETVTQAALKEAQHTFQNYTQQVKLSGNKN